MLSAKRIAAAALSAAMAAAALTACGDKSGGGKEKKSDYTVSLADLAGSLGAGWNYGNTLEANTGGTPSETAWGNPEASQAMVDAVAAAGFKTIRVPVSYLSKISDDGYKVDEAWLDRVEEVVGYCYNKGLNVIINVHGDGYNSINGGWLLCNGDDQETIKKKYEALWKQIAEKFATYDEHLIFESMNEEFDGEYHDPVPEYYDNINAYNQIFVDTVRAAGGNNSHRWLMVPGWNTNIDYTVGDYGFELPTDEKNTAGEGRVIVSVHCYDPWDYCGDESKKTFLWGERGSQIVEINKANPKNKASWGEEDHLESQMKKLKETFVDKGYPVVIGEFGCIDKTHANAGIPVQIAENRAYYDGYLAGIAATYGITPVYWDNGYNGQYGFGLFNRNTCEQTQPEIIKAIVDAVATKDPKVGLGANVTSGSETVEKQDSANAYIGIQTGVYTFRNAWDDGTYGKDSEWFNTLIRWEDTNGDGEDDIIDTGATFTDAQIKEDGTYTVSVQGYDFSGDCDELNMLFVSTDLPYSGALRVKDVVLGIDGQETKLNNPVISADASGNLYIEVVNKYNTEISGSVEYTMPKDSFSITFTLEGVSNVLK